MKKAALFVLFVWVIWFGKGQVLPSFGNSRTGTTGMQFLKIAPDARGASMAGSFSSVSNDPSAAYWNPAGLTHVDTAKVAIMLSQSSYFGGITSSFASCVFRGKKQSFWGISVFSMNYGRINETTEFQPTGTGRTFGITNYTITGSFARQLTNNFSFGVNAKFAQEGLAGVNTNNVMFDLGLRYDIGIRGARFAVSLSNYGLNVEPSGNVQILKFTGTQDITQFQPVSVPAIFRLGAAFNPIEKGNHILTTALQLNHPTDNNETLSFGAEYSYRKLLYFRSGYEFGQDEKGFPPAGFGIRLRRRVGQLRLDYAFSNKSRLGNAHRLSLYLVFNH